jgi:putative ABC transport system permease protein
VRYGNEEKILAFYRAVLDRLRAAPGVQSAAAAYPLPFGLGYETQPFQIPGRPAAPDERALISSIRLVTPEFFATLGVPLARGRTFMAQESEPVTVIDETLAQQYWPGQDAVGQFIIQGGVKSKIIGVIGAIRQADLASLPIGGAYYSVYQRPLAFSTLLIRTAGDPAKFAAVIRQAVNAVDPAEAIYDVKTMTERVNDTLAARRFTIALLGLFALAAISLAALGLYGVINYSVTQRTQEIGIRLVLGARHTEVLGLILRAGLRIALPGLAAGGIAAYTVSQVFSNQLFGVRAFDPLTFAAMGFSLAVVAIAATYLPARRATRLDPLAAVRYE